MSVRDIILCFTAGKIEWTRPESFLNGIDLVLERAVKILLAAMAPLDHPLKTPIHCLRIQLQTRIVRCVSQGPVEAAKVGRILGLGLPFAWKEGEMDVVLKTDHRNQHSETQVQSQVFFGDHFGGVAYKGDTNSIMKIPIALK